MNRILLALATIVASLGVAERASAYYAAHLGRFLTRDPAGEVKIGRFGQTAIQGFDYGYSATIDREQFDPYADYDDGPNLYQYASSEPTFAVDPYGLETAAPPRPVRPKIPPYRAKRPGYPNDGQGSIPRPKARPPFPKGGPVKQLIDMSIHLGKICYKYNQPIAEGFWPRVDQEDEKKRCAGRLAACYQAARDEYKACMEDADGDKYKEMDCFEQRNTRGKGCIDSYNECIDKIGNPPGGIAM